MEILNTQPKKTVFEADEDFPFKDLLLHKPISVLGEPHHFLIKIHLGTKTTPVYVQTPPCNLKEGGFSKAGKQTVADFIISNENSEFLLWMEKLEDFCHEQLLAKQSDWFETQLTEEDFDSLFLPPYKVVKGKGGKLVSVRASMPVTNKIKIFNESKEEVEFEEPFRTDQSVIAVLEIMGIKCSPRHFHIDFVVRQMMLLKETPLFSQCIISSKDSESTIVAPAPALAEVAEEPAPAIEPALAVEPALAIEPASAVVAEEPALAEEPVVVAEEPAVVAEQPVVVAEENDILEDLMENLMEEDDEKIELDIQEFDLEEFDFSKQILEKAKKARHLGIMEVLKSRQITFDQEKLELLLN